MDRQVFVGRPRRLPLPQGVHDMAWLAGRPGGILMIWPAIWSRLSATMSECPVILKVYITKRPLDRVNISDLFKLLSHHRSVCSSSVRVRCFVRPPHGGDLFYPLKPNKPILPQNHGWILNLTAELNIQHLSRSAYIRCNLTANITTVYAQCIEFPK